MSHLDPGPLAGYNSLQDKHLAGYFGNTKMKKHLVKSGLIKKNGEIVDDNAYRLKMAKKEHRRHVKDLLATAIVHKALDLERMRQYEMRKGLDELYKVELVQRVKNERAKKGDEDIVPLLLPPSRNGRRPRSHPGSAERRRRYSTSSATTAEEELSDRESLPEIRYDTQRHRRQLAKSAPPAGREVRMTEEQEDPYKRRYTYPHPPGKKKGAKKKVHRGLILARTDTAVAHRIQLQSMAEVTLKFIGPSLHLTNDMYSSHKLHEVTILQQHCGGSTLCVFKELLPSGTTFSFISRRHRGAPFGLTIYIDGVQDIRLSSCCEYKHKPGCKLGGKNAKFTFFGVTGAAPCYKCQAAFTVAQEKRGEKSRSRKSSSRTDPNENGEDNVGDVDGGEEPPLSVAIDSKEPTNNIDKEEEHGSDDVTENANEGGVKNVEEGIENKEIVTAPEQPMSSARADSSTQTEEDLAVKTEEDLGVKNEENGNVSNASKEDTQSDLDQEIKTEEAAYEEDDFEEDNEDEQEKLGNESEDQGERIARDKSDGSSSESDSDSSSSSDSESEEEESKAVKENKEGKKEKVEEKSGSDKEEEITEAAEGASEAENEHGNEKDTEEKGKSESEIEEDKDIIQKEESQIEVEQTEEDNKGTYDEDDFEDEGNESTHEEGVKENADDATELREIDEVEHSSSPNEQPPKEDEALSHKKGEKERENGGADEISKVDDSGKGQQLGEDQSDNLCIEKEDKTGDAQEEETEPPEVEADHTNHEGASSIEGHEDKESETEVEVAKDEMTNEDDATKEKTDEKARDQEEGHIHEDRKEDSRHDAPEETEEKQGDEIVPGDQVQVEPDDATDAISVSVQEEDGDRVDPRKDGENDAAAEEHDLDNSKESNRRAGEIDFDEGVADKGYTRKAENKEEEMNVEEPKDGGIIEVEGNKNADNSQEEEVTNSDESREQNENIYEEAGKVPEGEELANHEQFGEKSEAKELKADTAAGEGDMANNDVDLNKHANDDEKTDTAATIELDAEAKADAEAENVQEEMEGDKKSGDEETQENSADGTGKNDEEENEHSLTLVSDPEITNADLDMKSDTEAEELDAGNDPDKLANGKGSGEPEGSFDVEPGVKHDGPVAPLIESTSDVELNSVALSSAQVDELSNVVIKNSDNMDSLSLRNVSINDDGIEKIKEAVKNAENLQMLNLNLNSIGPSGAKHLAEVIRENKNLKMLMLHGNKLGDEGMTYIAEALLYDEKITTLDIGDCKIGDVGAVKIAELLKRNNTLTDLNLSGNDITNDGWEALAEGFKQNKALATLSLDFNNLRDEGIEILCEGIRDNTALKSIDFEGNKIGDAGGRRILAAVKNNESIVDVTIMPLNNISADIQDKIKDVLRYRGK